MKLMLRSGQGPASMGLQGHLQRIGGLISRIWEGTKGCLRKGCNSHVLKAHFVCHVDKGLESVLKSDTETINRRWSHCAGHRNGTDSMILCPCSSDIHSLVKGVDIRTQGY